MGTVHSEHCNYRGMLHRGVREQINTDMYLLFSFCIQHCHYLMMVHNMD